MPTVTLDTNVLPADDLRTALEPKGFEFAIVSVTERELGSSDLRAELQHLGTVPETGVWDESLYGQGLYGSVEGDNRLERLLQIITNNSFLKNRASLTPKQRRQLRDAMILYAHIREGREVFVTNDARAFVDHGRRETLQSEFPTQIMTREEFATLYLDA